MTRANLAEPRIERAVARRKWRAGSVSNRRKTVPLLLPSARTVAEVEPMSPRLQRQRRARAALSWCLGAFVGIQVLVTLSSLTWLPELRDPFFWTKAHRFEARQAAAPAALSVAFLGSSRTIHGIDGLTLEQALSEKLERPAVVGNLATFGAGPIHQLVHLRRLIERGIRPRAIVIEVLPMLLDDADQPTELALLPVEVLSPADLRVVMWHRSPSRDLQWEWLWTMLLPAYGQRAALVSGLSPSLLPYVQRRDWGRTCDATGWEPLKGEGQSPAVLAATRAEYQPRLAALRVGGYPCRAFEETLALAQREGLTAFVVRMPEGAAMSSWYDPVSRRQLDEFVQATCARHGARMVDARAWLPEESFRDSHHLYPDGARRFSTRLAETLAEQLR